MRAKLAAVLVAVAAIFAAPTTASAYLNVENAGVKCRDLNWGAASNNLSPWGPIWTNGIEQYTRNGNEDVTVDYRFYVNVYQVQPNGSVLYITDRYTCRVVGSNATGYVQRNTGWGVAWR